MMVPQVCEDSEKMGSCLEGAVRRSRPDSAVVMAPATPRQWPRAGQAPTESGGAGTSPVGRAHATIEAQSSVSTLQTVVGRRAPKKKSRPSIDGRADDARARTSIPGAMLEADLCLTYLDPP
jgi:hypothetical protein